jgi:hypothetical protein
MRTQNFHLLVCVLMDNLPVHKVAGVAEAIEAAGATLFIFRSIRRTSTRSSSPSAKSRFLGHAELANHGGGLSSPPLTAVGWAAEKAALFHCESFGSRCAR